MLASELITRALRLINEPGRGAQLSPTDQAEAFEALQEILDSEAVSKQFVPGIRRHFFSLTSGKSVYSYGASPQADLRSDNFDDDPAPIKIEDAYIRRGSSITDNELVGNYRFEDLGYWSLDSDPDVSIVDNQYVVETPAGATSTTQSISPTGATVYTLRVNAEINNGTVEIRLRESATPFETFILDADGSYEFDFTWPIAVSSDVEIVTNLTTDDIAINSLSIIERGLDRLELPDGAGSDYPVKIINQTRYNRRSSKGSSGQAYELLYSRTYPLAELRLDNSSVSGDILVMDVLVNRVFVNSLSDEIRMHPQAIKWLRYALADAVAGEYGKALSSDQIRIMSDAWTKLSTGHRRWNTLRVDAGMLNPRSFDINRGDP